MLKGAGGGGSTEKKPLSFAYTYYQYAKRTMADLIQLGAVTPEDASAYLGWWHLLILRGVQSVYTPFDSATERGSELIKSHLRFPILLYVLWEMYRLNIPLAAEHRILFRQNFFLVIPGGKIIRNLGRNLLKYCRRIHNNSVLG